VLVTPGMARYECGSRLHKQSGCHRVSSYHRLSQNGSLKGQHPCRHVANTDSTDGQTYRTLTHLDRLSLEAPLLYIHKLNKILHESEQPKMQCWFMQPSSVKSLILYFFFISTSTKNSPKTTPPRLSYDNYIHQFQMRHVYVSCLCPVKEQK